jgi:hypothetical protein
MRNLVIAAAVTVTLALGGVAAWQAKAAAPAGSIPLAGPYTPIHPAACNGTTGSEGCGPGWHYRNGPQGYRCYPC